MGPDPVSGRHGKKKFFPGHESKQDVSAVQIVLSFLHSTH